MWAAAEEIHLYKTSSAAWKAKSKELRELLSDRNQDLEFEYDRAEAAEKREEEAGKRIRGKDTEIKFLYERVEELEKTLEDK